MMKPGWLLPVTALLALGAVGTGCGGGSCPRYNPPPVRAGTYAHDPADRVGESEHSLVVSSDRQTVTESFVREGRRYTITYRVTGAL